MFKKSYNGELKQHGGMDYIGRDGLSGMPISDSLRI